MQAAGDDAEDASEDYEDRSGHTSDRIYGEILKPPLKATSLGFVIIKHSGRPPACPR
jgi:hypothetical protein